MTPQEITIGISMITLSSGAVNVYVQGHVIGASGIEEFCGLVNDAVQNRDVRLVASQTRQGPRATH